MGADDTDLINHMADVSSLRFGAAVTGLSMATGASPEALTLVCASILGGLAGPDAGLNDGRGTLIARPGCNAVILGIDSASWMAAEQLLLDPVESCSRALRRLSASVDGRRLDGAQAPITDRPENEHQASQIRDQLDTMVHNPDTHLAKNRGVELLRHPSFALRAPAPETFRVGVDEISQGHALIYYPSGRLLARLAEGKSSYAWFEHAGHLADALVGADIVFSKSGPIGVTRVRSLAATLYATASGKQVAAALGCGHGSVQQLLESCWLLDPTWKACHFEGSHLQTIEMGCSCYWEAVRDIFDRRKAASSLSFKLTGDSHAELIKGIQDMQGRLANNIPADYLPFLREWRKLPAKLLWALLALSGGYESTEGAVSTALYVAEWAVLNHVQVLRGIVEAERKRRDQLAREAMLMKLADGPQTLRELMRRTSGSQRREIHQPVLQTLINEGAVLVDAADRYSLAQPLTKQVAP